MLQLAVQDSEPALETTAVLADNGLAAYQTEVRTCL